MSAPAFVWAIWVLSLLMALQFMARFGYSVPKWDEWNFVPVLTGEQPVNLSWLWSQYSDHRFPLAKLVLATALRWAGGDFRVGTYLNVFCLASLAAGLILVTRKFRGETTYADAFFPIVLLNLGHADTLIWGMILTYVIPSVLAGSVLIIIVASNGRLSVSTAAVAGLCTIGLALSGANGLIYAVPLATWLAYAGYRHLHEGEPIGRRAGAIALILASMTFMLSGVYFIGFRPSSSPLGHDPEFFFGEVAKGTQMFLAVSFGAAARSCWTWLGPVMATLCLSSGWCAVRSCLRPGSRDRTRDLGLLAFLVGGVGLALAIGWGRGRWAAESLLQSCYAAMAAPLLCGIYLTWDVCGPKKIRALVRFSLFTLVVSLFWLNWWWGQKIGFETHARQHRLEVDLRTESPVSLLVNRNRNLFPFHDQLRDQLLALKRAGFWRYRNVMEDPPFREVVVPLRARRDPSGLLARRFGEFRRCRFLLDVRPGKAGLRVRRPRQVLHHQRIGRGCPLPDLLAGPSRGRVQKLRSICPFSNSLGRSGA